MKTLQIELSEELVERLKHLANENGLSSVEDYILFVLQTHVEATGLNEKKDEEEEVRKRLENLGYL